MSAVQFKQVNFSLSTLVDQIDMGTIGLPDIQRPFVWKTVKVRDLFDSMYRGYPVGYLLFWENMIEPGAKQIGTEGKQLAPQQLIVDGQQRLTSLYAVIKGKPIVNSDFKQARIRIAFRPTDQKFEVTNPAIEKDAEWIPDISLLWSPDVGFLGFVKGFLERLKSVREVPAAEEQQLENAIERLKNLVNFPFTALALSSQLDEEKVSEIFVRINSEGVSLKQADFILTLMSVFWEKGRRELEEFCRDARNPAPSGPSPHNHHITPTPDQLLRASVALAFRRARLQHVYSILRGKDLQTKEFSSERRDAQFVALQQAQDTVLDLTNWHEFFKTVTASGYRSSEMVASETNLIYTYALWLVGRRDFGVDLKRLRQVLARWFYMTSVTSRYTGSSETQMEADMARLRNLTTADEFVEELDRICRSELTNDFWEIRLPNDLERRSVRSPSLFSYYAALNVLDAKVLFSQMKVAELFDPTVKGKKAAMERHHLFPKAYLDSIGISDLGEVNQIANYALVEWSDNIQISDAAPVDYWSLYVSMMSGADLDQMMFWHALPEGWQEKQYRDFLVERRQKMAEVIRAGWEKLQADEAPIAKTGVAEHLTHAPEHWTIEELLERKESARVEFKSSARWNYKRGDKGKEIEDSIVKTVAGFMNKDGGTLIIGVDDDANILGLRKDLSTLSRNDLDGYENWLHTLFETSIGKPQLHYLSVAFVEIDDEHLARIDVKRPPRAVWAKTSEKPEAFFVRTGNSTRELGPQEAIQYISDRFGPAG